jgi:hypothetical protein
MWVIWLIIIALVLWYFFIKNSTPSKRHIENDQNFSVDDIVDGYEYYATLDIYTPLKALKHHGEFRKGPKSKLPEYGNSRDGIWLEYLKKYSSPPSAEDLRELKFLKKFREIYEGNSSISEKHEDITELIKGSRDSRQASYASGWYLWELLEISGISESIAEVLYADGVKTKKDVKETADDKLLNIPGIGRARLKQIRTYFSRP